jgi:hypothetical protein
MAALGLVFALTTTSLAAPANETPAQFVTRLMAIYQPDGGWWKAWPDTAAGRRADAAYQKTIYAEFYDPAFVKLSPTPRALARTSTTIPSANARTPAHTTATSPERRRASCSTPW